MILLVLLIMMINPFQFSFMRVGIYKGVATGSQMSEYHLLDTFVKGLMVPILHLLNQE